MPIQSTTRAAETYEQILDLIEDLIAQTADAADDIEDGVIDHAGIVHNIVEEAGERGLDEDQIEKIFKAISALARKA